MATSKKAAPKKADKKTIKKNRSRKSSTPGRKKKGFKRSVEPLNLSNAIQQPMPNANVVFDGSKAQSTGKGLLEDAPDEFGRRIYAALHDPIDPVAAMNKLDKEVTEKIQNAVLSDPNHVLVQEYMDYKSANPIASKEMTFQKYIVFKANNISIPVDLNADLMAPAPSKDKATDLERLSTNTAYSVIMDRCMKVFGTKLADYGASWRIFRLGSIADQIFIKANRIRTIQEAGVQKIGDTIQQEYIGIVNYGIIALIQEKLLPMVDDEDGLGMIGELYDGFSEKCFQVMQQKNHDYGESWKYMQVESFCDMILVRLKRIQQIIANKGAVQDSEPLDQNFIDIVNYAVFALIRYSN